MFGMPVVGEIWAFVAFENTRSVDVPDCRNVLGVEEIDTRRATVKVHLSRAGNECSP